MQTMTLFTADKREAYTNTVYPHKREIHSEEEFLEAMRYDCIFGEMKGNRRAEDNFISLNGVMNDLDNTHSDDPYSWKSLDDVQEAFPDVMFYHVQSRNHMKPKKKENSKTGEVRYQEPREKEHICFPIRKKINSYEDAKKLMMCIVGLFPFFDIGAAKPVQPMFGVEKPVGGCVEGSLCIDEYIDSIPDLKERIKDNLQQYSEKISSGEYGQSEENKKALSALFSYFKLSDSRNDSASTSDRIAIDDNWIEAEEQRQQIEWFKGWAKDHDQEIIGSYGINTEGHKKAAVFNVHCPWEHEHSMNGAENESVVIIDQTGKLNFLCRHSHGIRMSWTKYRKEVEAKHPTKSTKDNERAAKTDPVYSIKPISGRALQEKDIPEMQFAVEGMLPEGYSIFSGAFKSAKSFMALQMGLDVAAGKEFLGQKTTKGTVLYLALEDNEKTGQDRLNKLLNNAPAPDNFFFVFNPRYDPEKPSDRQDCVPTLDTGLLEFLDAFCQEHDDVRLIVIDVLGLVEYDAKKTESAYKHDYRTGSALKRWAESRSVAVCSITHTTKAPHLSDIFMNTTGTNGVTGSADSILTLSRERGKSDGVLAITGRCVKSRYLKVHFDDETCLWHFDGYTSPDGQKDEQREKQAAEKLEEYQNSKIREAVLKIAKGTNAEDAECMRAAEVKDKARDFGVYILDTNKDIGMFLHQFQNYFMEYDGVGVEIIKNGSGSKQYRFKYWEQATEEDQSVLLIGPDKET